MSDAARDQNHVASALGVSSSNATLTLPFLIDPITGRLLTDSASGSGDVVGPASSTDNAAARFDGITGKLLQNSVVLIGDTGNITGVGTLNALTLPASNFVGLTDSQVLTNKTISGASNTLTVRLASDVTGNLPVTNLNSGTSASSSTFWRGDGTWSTPGGSGDVVGPSSATDNAIARFDTTTGKLIQNSPVTVADSTGVIAGTQGVVFSGSSSGTTTLQANAAAGTTTLTLPAATDTLVGKATTDTFTNKTYDTAGTGNSFSINGVAVTANSGTGAVARVASPAFTTPSLGVATATSINGLTLTASTGTLTITNLKTLSVSNSLTFTGTDSSSVAFGAGGTVLYNGGALGTPSSGTLTNCGSLPISGLTSSTSTALGVGSLELGNASDTTLSRSSGGVLAVEGVVIPSVSSTNTFTNKRVTRRTVTVNVPGATPSTNTDNVDVAEFTGLGTAITSMTTNLSGTPVNHDFVEFFFVDDGTARAITWGSSFANGGLVNLPTTTVVSTALRVLVEYQTTASLNKWVCVAVA